MAPFLGSNLMERMTRTCELYTGQVILLTVVVKDKAVK